MSTPELPSESKSNWLMMVFWLCILGSLTLFFNGFIQKRENPNYALLTSDEQREVVLTRNRAGHYVAPGEINGYQVTFLLDTGATDISIPAKLADNMGLKKGLRQQVSTANGVVSVYQTQLNSVQVGGIKMMQLTANINPHASDDLVLLGMSFMKHLELIQRDKTLTLRVPENL